MSHKFQIPNSKFYILIMVGLLLGIISVGQGLSKERQLIFKEVRQWQIASDITCGFGSDIDGVQCRGTLATTGAGTWSVPADWSNTNKIEAIGGGGGGGTAAADATRGGGGGAYASTTIAGLSGIIDVAVGEGGTAGINGGDTWFGSTTCAGANVCAGGGKAGIDDLTGGEAGTVVVGTGFSGGAGGDSGDLADDGGGGGGGAAGPGGAGGNGGASAPGEPGGGGGGGAGDDTPADGGEAVGATGGAGGNGPGETGGGASGGGNGTAGTGGGGGGGTTSQNGGNGATGSEWSSGVGAGGGGGGGADAGEGGNGGLYGGGGGGQGEDAVTAAGFGASGQGIIVITYTPAAANQTPSVATPVFNGGLIIDLYASTTRTITATTTITDADGWANIATATAVFYNSSTTASCSANENICYVIASCTLTSTTTSSRNASCTADMWFDAVPTTQTDWATTTGYATTSWIAWIKGIDASNASSSATTSQELNALAGLEVVQSNIQYGSLGAGATSSTPISTQINTVGNCPINSNISGVDMVSNGNNIPITQQKYDLNDVGWESMSVTASSTNQLLDLDSGKTTDRTNPASDLIYWGIKIPDAQAQGTYNGTSTFSVIEDTIDW